MFCSKSILRNCSKFASLKPATSLKKRLQHRCFRVNFAKFEEHLFWYNMVAVSDPFSLAMEPFVCFHSSSKIAAILSKNSSKNVLQKGFSFSHSRSYICYPETLRIWGIIYCVKNIRIRSFSGPHFSHISPHSERYGEIRSISPNAEKCGKNAN